VVIRIFARGFSRMADEALGIILIKGVFIGSCEHTSHAGRASVSQRLKTWCKTIEKATNFPGEIVKLEIQCTKINISVQDRAHRVLRFVANPATAKQLKHICNAISQPADKKVAFVFHAAAYDLESLENGAKMSGILQRGTRTKLMSSTRS
jgi:hypothetical protein